MGIPTTRPEDRRYVPPLDGRPSPEGTLLGGPPPAPPPTSLYDHDSQNRQIAQQVPAVPPPAGAASQLPAQGDARAGRGIAVTPELPPGTKREDGPGQIVVLPDGSRIPDTGSRTRSPTGYVMSPRDNLAEVAAAGRRAAQDLRVQLQHPGSSRDAAIGFMWRNFLSVGTGGKYDYQREGHQFLGHLTGFTQLRQFHPIANINVGLFSQQAGMTLEETLRAAGRYAELFSSNYHPNEPYGLDPRTAHYIEEGFRIGETGMFDRPGLP